MTTAVNQSEAEPVHVLITGFGPFSTYDVNPSWLAVKALHNAVLTVPLSAPSTPDKARGDLFTAPRSSQQRQRVFVTVLQMPVAYDAVLSRAPGLHAAPPQLPEPIDLPTPPAYVPPRGFDFVMHVGVAGRGPLRLEKRGHKTGYNKPDAAGQLAPVMHTGEEEDPQHPVRGAGERYTNMPEDLFTDVDVGGIVQYLLHSGAGDVLVRASDDAGHYLCDFINYVSQAEALIRAERGAAVTNSAAPRETTPVLFLHCCPKDDPYSTEQVTETIKAIVLWICGNRL